MAQQTFQTAAIISMMDQLSGPLSSLASRVSHMTRAANAEAGNASAAAAAQTARDMREHRRAVREFATASAIAVGGMSIKMTRHIAGVGLEIDRLQTKMLAFTDATPAEVERLRRMARTDLNRYGGPQQVMKTAHGLQTAGLTAETAPAAIPYVHALSKDQNLSGDEAAEEMSKMITMLRLLKDDTGKNVSLEKATSEQIKVAAAQALGATKQFGMLAPGNTRDTMQFFKYFAPAMHASKMSLDDAISFGALAARGGIMGDEAGNMMRMTASRLMSPNNTARSAFAAAGIKNSDYLSFDMNSMTSEAYMAYLKKRIGEKKVKKGTKEQVDTAFAAHGKTGDNAALETALSNIALNQGVRTLKDQTSAAGFAANFMGNFATSVRFTDLMKRLWNLSSDNQEKVARSMGVTDKDRVVTDKNGKVVEGQQASWLQGLLNKLFTSQQGNRLGGLNMNDFDDISARVKEMDRQKLGDSVVEVIQGSVSNAVDRMKGSFDGLSDSLFEAWQKEIKDFATKVAEGFETMAGMDENSRKFIGGVTAVTAAVATAATALAAIKITGGLLSLASGGGAAAGGTAVGATGAGVGTGAATTAASRLPMFASGALAPIGIAAATGAIIYGTVGEANRKTFEGLAPGERHDVGQRQRRKVNQMTREQMLADREADAAREAEPNPFFPRNWKENRQRAEEANANRKPVQPLFDAGDIISGFGKFLGNAFQPSTLGKPEKQDVSVTGNMTGDATIKGDIKVTAVPTADFWSRIDSKIDERVSVKMSGAVNKQGQTHSGSNAATNGTPKAAPVGAQ